MIFIKNALVVIFVILGVVFLLLCLYTFLLRLKGVISLRLNTIRKQKGLYCYRSTD